VSAQKTSPLISALFFLTAACSSAPTDPSVASDELVVEPASYTLTAIGDSIQFSVIERDASGRKSPCAGSEWKSTNNRVATVTGNGKVIAKGLGFATIVAACGGASASASLQVDSSVNSDLPAFPGAEGWGATALGSCNRSNPQVLRVANLDDSGAGSFREAMSQVDPNRLSIVKFDVAGRIVLDSRITFRGSCVYVAGQTAPGGGITISAPGKKALYVRGANAHDIVIRHLRFRNGYAGDVSNSFNIMIADGIDIVLDHLSLSWSSDKLLGISKFSWSQPIHGITVQRTIISEILGEQPTAVQITGNDEDGATDWRHIYDLTLHHNLFAHNGYRNPAVTTFGTEFINNVVYNWVQSATQTGQESKLDAINNYYRIGPMNDARFTLEVTWDCRDTEEWTPSFYVSGNLGPNNADDRADNWTDPHRVIGCYYKSGGSGGEPIPDYARYRRLDPLPAPPLPVSTTSARVALESVLADVGANARVSCEGEWVPNSDAVDQRVISDTRDSTGQDWPIRQESEVGGFPEIRADTACEDSDFDGMPDAFEARYGLDPKSPVDASQDSDGDGYTNIEEYVNGSPPR